MTTKKVGDELADRAKEWAKAQEGKKPPKQKKEEVESEEEKPCICPFMSNHKHKVPCNSECALYRANKKRGWNCPMSEFTSMSYNLNGRPTKQRKTY